MTYLVGDDSTITYPVTDTAEPPGTLDFDPVVHARNTAGGQVTVTAAWAGTPAAARDLDVPLSALPAGLWSLRLVLDGAEDLFLGNVFIQ